ncbi:radical SAM protein [Vibrio gallicus]|uniref:radical SAM protein n=1 Tax=Vibrio gallicus TaxID=190897 RepID=UPI0021C28FFD|nr:radical SAM protein [Vibrio gallicus]
MLEFEQGPIRPPSEANSLLIRTTQGCPWNKCNFCTLFKGVEFSIRPVEDIKKDIWAARRFYAGKSFDSCFLQDGDSFAMPTEDLLDVLATLKQAFPELKQISSYGRAQTMIKKSAQELKAICDAGLNMLYCGLESGSVEVLKQAKKGITPKAIIKSSQHAKAAGMQMMVFVLLGLGGKALSKQHVSETAAVLNAIQPDEIRLLSLAIKSDTELDNLVQKGTFEPLSETEMIIEQRNILSALDLKCSRYGNYHGINILTEVNGQLPHDKTAMLEVIDQYLAMNETAQNNFVLGRRLNYYTHLTDMNNQLMSDTIQQEITRIYQQYGNDAQSRFEELFATLRQRMI